MLTVISHDCAFCSRLGLVAVVLGRFFPSLITWMDAIFWLAFLHSLPFQGFMSTFTWHHLYLPWISAVLNPQKDSRYSAPWVVIPRSARGCWTPDSIFGPQTFFSAAVRSIDFSAQLTLLGWFLALVRDVGLIGTVLRGQCIWFVPLLSGKWLVGSWKIVAQSVILQ